MNEPQQREIERQETLGDFQFVRSSALDKGEAKTHLYLTPFSKVPGRAKWVWVHKPKPALHPHPETQWVPTLRDYEASPGQVFSCTILTPCVQFVLAQMLVEDSKNKIVELSVYNFCGDPSRWFKEVDALPFSNHTTKCGRTGHLGFEWNAQPQRSTFARRIWISEKSKCPKSTE